MTAPVKVAHFVLCTSDIDALADTLALHVTLRVGQDLDVGAEQVHQQVVL